MTPESGAVPLTRGRGRALVAEADLVAQRVQVGSGWIDLQEGKEGIVGVAGDRGAVCWAVSDCEGGICPILSLHRRQALWTLRDRKQVVLAGGAVS